MQNTLFDTAPQQTKAENLIFNNMEDIKAAISEIKKEETTFERLKELQTYFINNEDKTAAEIVSRLTIASINTFIFSHPGSKKAQLVKSMTGPLAKVLIFAKVCYLIAGLMEKRKKAIHAGKHYRPALTAPRRKCTKHGKTREEPRQQHLKRQWRTPKHCRSLTPL